MPKPGLFVGTGDGGGCMAGEIKMEIWVDYT